MRGRDSARTSGTFCARWAEAKGRVEAAKKRNELDLELKDLRSQIKQLGVVPMVADAFSENVAAILGVVLGRHGNDRQARD